MKIVFVIVVTLLLSQYFIEKLITMLCDIDKEVCCTVNYRGNAIPAIGGIVFIPILLVAILLLLLSGAGSFTSYVNHLALALSMGFVGVVDDLAGDKSIKGIKGHINSTLKGSMTTGFLKAFIGFVVSSIISSAMVNTPSEFVTNIFVISLSANTLNIFDLRPGRAVKVFTAASLMIISGAIGRFEEAAPLIVLVGAALLYIRYDLKEICMLGDTGANILGITLGYYIAVFSNMNIKLIILALLICVNLVSDRISITELIKRNRVLSYIDSLGRGEISKNDRHN